MGERLDELFGELGARAGATGSDDLEGAVWRRLDAAAAPAGRGASSAAVQGLIAVCALAVGFSVQAYRQGRTAAPAEPLPAAVTLLDGSAVADAGSFQVLR